MLAGMLVSGTSYSMGVCHYLGGGRGSAYQIKRTPGRVVVTARTIGSPLTRRQWLPGCGVLSDIALGPDNTQPSQVVGSKVGTKESP
jgi:hypothetical protein